MICCGTGRQHNQRREIERGKSFTREFTPLGFAEELSDLRWASVIKALVCRGAGPEVLEKCSSFFVPAPRARLLRFSFRGPADRTS